MLCRLVYLFEQSLEKFSLHELVHSQRQSDLWRYDLESGDESNLPKLAMPFSHFFLSQEGVLCRYLPQKHETVSQLVIPDSDVGTYHITFISWWCISKQKVILNNHESWCRLTCVKFVKCAQLKGTAPKPAPILQDPPPEESWDAVAIDLLHIPASHQGSWYLLACVDHFSRFVILAPLQNKTAETVTHALTSNLFCPYSMPHALLSDNEAEFRNALLEEISR